MMIRDVYVAVSLWLCCIILSALLGCFYPACYPAVLALPLMVLYFCAALWIVVLPCAMLYCKMPIVVLRHMHHCTWHVHRCAAMSVVELRGWPRHLLGRAVTLVSLSVSLLLLQHQCCWVKSLLSCVICFAQLWRVCCCIVICVLLISL